MQQNMELNYNKLFNIFLTMCCVALCSATQQLQRLSGCATYAKLSNFIGSKNTNPRQSMHITVRDRVQTNTVVKFFVELLFS